jgi:hypothetical protein
MLLDEGRKVLAEEGLQTTSSNLTFKRVFDRVDQKTGERITNASVIRRIWENQADYQADVLVAVTQDQARPEAGATVGAIASVLASVDLCTVESRAAAVREVFRSSGNASSSQIGRSDVWPLWIGVIAMAASASSPARQRRFTSALAEGFDSVAAFWSENFEFLMEALGLRIRPDFTLDQFVSMVIALAQGSSIRQRVGDRNEMMIRPTGPNGEYQEWSPFAVGLESLVHQFMEPDPEWSPPA